MTRKILLTGASGEVGFEALKELIRRKNQYTTRILSLGTPKERKLFKPYENQVEIIWGDIRNPSAISQAVENIDTVLHVAGIIPPLADHSPELARQVNIEGTRNLVQAMQAQKTRPNLVFTSSISVYGDRLKNPKIRIDDPLNPSEGDEYARTKIEAETVIRESGLKWTIYRLCGILVKKLRLQPLMFHMPLNTALEWCHASDAGYALVESIGKENILNRIFNLGGGEKCRTTARNFMGEMFPIMGLDSRILPEHAFATQNFHSGFYTDGDDLDQILKFRRKTLQDYFDDVRKRVPPWQRSVVKILPAQMIRNWLLRMSEPLQAIETNNEILIQRYYGSREAFNRLLKK